jgi:hypothetical protein
MLASQQIRYGTWWMPAWLENVLFCIAIGLLLLSILWAAVAVAQ